MATIGGAPLEFQLRNGETAVARSVISPGIYWKSLLMFVFSLIVAVAVHPNLGAFFLVVSGFMFVLAYLRKYYTVVLVTNERLLIRQGVGFVDSVQLRFPQVESVEIMRTLVGLSLGYGSLIVTGVGNRITMVPFLANAAGIRQAIDDQMSKEEHGNT